MNKKQFFRRNSHLNVDESEISRKWRVYQEEQEFLMMVEAERQWRGQATIPSPGGGSGSLDQEVIYSLSLSFDDISSANILVGDSSNVVDWNLFFDLPTYGNPFTSVVIVGNGVQLFGGSDITIKENTFISNNSIIKVIDLGCVTSIYTDSFSYCENITEISFPECLDITGGEYFDAGAFYGLLSLTSMYFPKLIAIDNQCFSNCTSLTTIDLPNLTIAGENSFSNCSSLTTIDLPLLTTTAGETCFYNCTSLTTIDLPLLTTAGGDCFYNCTSLTTIDLPLLTTAGDGCFRNCTSLTTVDLPSLTTAGNNCFRDCTLPTTVNLPLLTTADGSCFAYCTSLTTVDLPLLTTAGETCFYSCTSLTTIDLPLLTTTGDSCFQDCTALTTISLPLLTMTGNYCFANCASLTTISLPECTNLGSTVGDNAVFANITGQTITLTVPLSLMTCNGGNPDGDIQFLQANNTVTIVISDPALRLTFDSITNADLLVGDSADVTDWNTFFDLPTYGNPFTGVDIAGNEVRLYGGSDITIKDSLFRGNTHLITIDDSIGCIIGTDDRCFDTCESLTSVNLPELTSANYYSFGNCTSLTSVYLPKLITTGTYVFADCTNLVSVNLPLLEIAGTGLFEYSSALTTINMPSCTNLGATVGDDGVFFDIIGNTITLTVPSALMTCNGGLPDGDIQYLQANNTVTIIEIQPSLNLTFDNITNVPVADASSVTDWNTFFDLPTYGNPFTNVEVSGNTVSLFGGSNIDLKDSLFVISGQGPALQQINDNAGCIISAGYNVFGDEEDIGCPNLTTVYLPELLSAGGSCFISTRNLINVSMDKVISIGSYCFNGSNLLSTISLPVVQSIGDGAFGSTILTTISIPSCINLGSTVGYNDVFNNITGQTIILTVPSALMTCNGGLPDGDIQYLQANNTVTIIEIQPSLNLTFDSITNADLLVGDSADVTDWNTFFDLPTYGNPFTSVEVSGNEVNLIGGSEIILIDGLFVYYDHLIKVEDSGSVITIMGTFEECGGLTEVSFNGCTQVFLGDADYGSFGYSTVVTANFPVCTYMETGFYGSNLVSIFAPLLEEAGNDCFASCNLTTIDLPSLITAGNSCFNSCDSLTTISLPSLITAGYGCFNYCDLLTTINLPVVQSIGYGAFASTILTTINLSSCTDLGGTVGDDGVFDRIIGNTITLTIPAALMICNGGNPDGDIQYLQANNTVTIIEIPASLNLTFDNITNVPVADANSVSDWNTFFDLPTYGNPFTNVEVIGNEVNLIGGSNITLKYLLFEGNQHLLKVIDNSSVVKLRDACFDSCYNLTNVYLPEVLETTSEGGFYGPFGYCENLIEAYLPKLTIIASLFYDCFNLTDSGLTLPFDEILSIGTSENIFGNGVIEGCNSLTELNFPNAINTIELSFINCIGLITINLPNLITLGNGSFGACRSLSVINLSSCISLGTTVGNNYIFEAIEGNTITLTVPSALMTCNGGLPDGDIQYLQANNTVTIIEIPTSLNLTFDNITNVPVADASSVTDWNTFFDLPINGTPFTTVVVNGNEVQLLGGSGITIKNDLFSSSNLVEINDYAGCLVIAGNYSFYDSSSLNVINLPALTELGISCFESVGTYEPTVTINLASVTTVNNSCFQGSPITNLNLSNCINLGTTVGNNNVFRYITGNTITLTVPSALMTCQLGNPDGDIQYLQANNTVTIITT